MLLYFFFGRKSYEEKVIRIGGTVRIKEDVNILDRIGSNYGGELVPGSIGTLTGVSGGNNNWKYVYVQFAPEINDDNPIPIYTADLQIKR